MAARVKHIHNFRQHINEVSYIHSACLHFIICLFVLFFLVFKHIQIIIIKNIAFFVTR